MWREADGSETEVNGSGCCRSGVEVSGGAIVENEDGVVVAEELEHRFPISSILFVVGGPSRVVGVEVSQYECVGRKSGDECIEVADSVDGLLIGWIVAGAHCDCVFGELDGGPHGLKSGVKVLLFELKRAMDE